MPATGPAKEFSDVFGAYALGRFELRQSQGEPRKLDEIFVIYSAPASRTNGAFAAATSISALRGGYPAAHRP